MTVIPGLTSTRKELIPAFLEDLLRLGVSRIALFPTCLDGAERTTLYRELERIEGLRIPHVHLRADCAEEEAEYLAVRFGTEAFNIHPRSSTHPYGEASGALSQKLFVENVDVPPESAELAVLGGLCPDFSHLQNARLQGRDGYVRAVEAALDRFPVGCCHLSAIRVGDPNVWSGEWDHHNFKTLSDFDYLVMYRERLNCRWGSLELENSLGEQLNAARYLERLLA